MKRVIMMVMLIMMGSSVNSYAGKGLFGCCCGSGDEEDGGSTVHSPLVPRLGVKYIYDFKGFKQWYTQDGDCEMWMRSFYGSTEIEEDLKAGKGSKAVVIEGVDFMHKRVAKDIYIYMQQRGEKGTIMQKGSIIDCEKGEIRHPGGGSSSEKGIGIPVDLYRRLGYLK